MVAVKYASKQATEILIRDKVYYILNVHEVLSILNSELLFKNGTHSIK